VSRPSCSSPTSRRHAISFKEKVGFSIVFVYREPPSYAQAKRDRALIKSALH